MATTRFQFANPFELREVELSKVSELQSFFPSPILEDLAVPFLLRSPSQMPSEPQIFIRGFLFVRDI